VGISRCDDLVIDLMIYLVIYLVIGFAPHATT
jgi:hypothetical protein